MSYLPHLLVLAGVWALVVISPGPDFVVTMSRAAGSRRAGLAATAGIAVGTAIWASVSAAGAGIVLERYQWAAVAVRTVAVAAAWYSAVACAFSLAVIKRRYRQAKKWIDRVTGGVLVGLAVRLAAER